MESHQWDLLVSPTYYLRRGGKKGTREGELTGSCFNAFSRVDVRVDVKIPGGVEAYVIDLRGER